MLSAPRRCLDAPHRWPQNFYVRQNFYVQLLGRALRVQRRITHTESDGVCPTEAYRVPRGLSNICFDLAQAYRVRRDFSNISIQSPTRFVQYKPNHAHTCFKYKYGQGGTCIYAARERRTHASLLAASPLLEAQPCIKRFQSQTLGQELEQHQHVRFLFSCLARGHYSCRIGGRS